MHAAYSPVASSSTGNSAKRKHAVPPVATPLPFAPPSKRRQDSISSLSSPTTITRDILPKPLPGPEIRQNDAFVHSPTSASPEGQAQPKKRGRPTRAEVERREQDAIREGRLLGAIMTSPMSLTSPDGSRMETLTPARILPQLPLKAYPPTPAPPSSSQMQQRSASHNKQIHSSIDSFRDYKNIIAPQPGSTSGRQRTPPSQVTSPRPSTARQTSIAHLTHPASPSTTTYQTPPISRDGRRSEREPSENEKRRL